MRSYFKPGFWPGFWVGFVYTFLLSVCFLLIMAQAFNARIEVRIDDQMTPREVAAQVILLETYYDWLVNTDKSPGMSQETLSHVFLCTLRDFKNVRPELLSDDTRAWFSNMTKGKQEIKTKCTINGCLKKQRGGDFGQ